MNITNELLDRYFKDQCNIEERDAIHVFLTEINEFPDHLLMKDEWDSTCDEDLSQEKSDQLFVKIKCEAYRKSQFKRWLRDVTRAAAVILMVIGLGYYALTTHNLEPKPVLNEKKVNETKHSVDWKSTVNYANNVEDVILPDGSVVKVYPGAEIRYELPLFKKKREVYLKGKGYFKVKEDKQHPFVVYASGVSTTALGTSFTITVSKSCALVKVELHKGKVLVKNMQSDKQTPVFSNILKPGEVLLVDKLKWKLSVSSKKTVTPEASPTTEDLVQVPLGVIFNKLEKCYKVKISFKEEDVRSSFFTGTLQVDKSADSVLAEIAELNKLTLVKTLKGYLIIK